MQRAEGTRKLIFIHTQGIEIPCYVMIRADGSFIIKPNSHPFNF